MRVVFYLAAVPSHSEYFAMAEKMLSSIRVHMPEAKVFQHTDLTTKEVGGVDGVVRLQFKDYSGAPLLVPHRFALLATEDECLSLDCDIFLMASLTGIFDAKFDVALVKRQNPIFYQGEDLMQTQPYIGSVMASRCPKFWEDCVAECEKQDDKGIWFGGQRAKAVVAKSGRYAVHELPENTYSYTPKTFGDPLGDIKAVHYKGNNRKSWMLAA